MIFVYIGCFSYTYINIAHSKYDHRWASSELIDFMKIRLKALLGSVSSGAWELFLFTFGKCLSIELAAKGTDDDINDGC